MKKRTAFIGAILSLYPLVNTLILKTGISLSTTGLMLFVHEKVYAGDYSYYFNSAFDKTENGDYYGAIADYTKAIEINPNEAIAYYNRGLAKYYLKDYYGAVADYTKAIEINPNDGDTYYNRGLAKYDLKDYEGAISDSTKAIEINTQYVKAYTIRGLAKHDLEDYYGAIADYTKAIEIDSSYGLAYSNRGYTKGIGFSDDEGACDDFKKAASLGYQYRIDWLQTSEAKWCKDM